jgi:hypothetical protein
MKEWTLHAAVEIANESGVYIKVDGPPILEDTKVVEYSAYNQAVYELDKCRADRDRYAKERDQLAALINENANLRNS